MMGVNPAVWTPLSLNRNCENWPVKADKVHRRSGVNYDEPEYSDTATLRRIGWLDQKGRVWLYIPPAKDFDGGSLSPLLIDPRED